MPNHLDIVKVLGKRNAIRMNNLISIFQLIVSKNKNYNASYSMQTLIRANISIRLKIRITGVIQAAPSKNRSR